MPLEVEMIDEASVGYRTNDATTAQSIFFIRLAGGLSMGELLFFGAQR